MVRNLSLACTIQHLKPHQLFNKRLVQLLIQCIHRVTIPGLTNWVLISMNISEYGNAVLNGSSQSSAYCYAK